MLVKVPAKETVDALKPCRPKLPGLRPFDCSGVRRPAHLSDLPYWHCPPPRRDCVHTS